MQELKTCTRDRKVTEGLATARPTEGGGNVPGAQG